MSSSINTTPELIAVFPSTREFLRALPLYETALHAPARVIPTPTRLSECCGMCIAMSREAKAVIVPVWEKESIAYELVIQP